MCLTGLKRCPCFRILFATIIFAPETIYFCSLGRGSYNPLCTKFKIFVTYTQSYKHSNALNFIVAELVRFAPSMWSFGEAFAWILPKNGECHYPILKLKDGGIMFSRAFWRHKHKCTSRKTVRRFNTHSDALAGWIRWDQCLIHSESSTPRVQRYFRHLKTF